MRLLLLIPDGVGIRNFLYTDFLKSAKEKGIEVLIWANEDILSLVDEQIETEILINEKPLNFWAELFRKVWSISLLKLQARKFQNPIYFSYIFRKNPRKLSKKVIYFIEELLINFSIKESWIGFYRRLYLRLAKSSDYYIKCRNQLFTIKPDYVFCSHQRASAAIAPLLAARELGIKTGTFIFSWDNVPKASLYVLADHYYVWSKHMMNEMIKYHDSFIDRNGIFITGTPQFEPFFDENNYLTRIDFSNKYNLPLNRKWICFSGDDLTTSPNDQIYLDDLAQSVQLWNENSNNEKLHIIFRPCPVDFSERYDSVLSKYNDIISLIRPNWDQINEDFGWNKIVPKKSDMSLLVNTVLHCELVVNLGSTMAFDFSIFNKPTIYIAYNPENNCIQDVSKVYKYVHFETMNGLNPVIWAINKDRYSDYIEIALYNNKQIVDDCKKWREIVCDVPLINGSNNILNTICKVA